MEQTMHHHDAGFATQQVQRVEASRPLFWRSHGAGARDPRDSRVGAGRIGRPSSPQAALTSTTEVVKARGVRAFFLRLFERQLTSHSSWRSACELFKTLLVRRLGRHVSVTQPAAC